MRKYDPEWATFVIEDLRAFFDANGMHDSADAMVVALRVVRRDCENRHNSTNKLASHLRM